MKSTTFLGLIYISIVFFVCGSCGLLGEEQKQQVTYEHTVYASVFFEETLENGAPKQGLIAINYDNPSEFHLLSSGEFSYRDIRVSPDGERIIYNDHYTSGGTSLYGIYDQEKQKAQLLRHQNGDWVPGLTSLGVVWNASGTGFYTTNPKIPFTSHQQLMYYNLKDSTLTTIRAREGKIIYPVGLKGKDTLIVFSNEFTAPSYRFYMMSLEGEYLEEISNPYLQHDVEEETLITNLAWSNSEQLFAASYSNGEEFEGFKIIVTDLKGEVFEEFTEGKYRNKSPAWTHDGKIVFTTQVNQFAESRVDSKLRLLDPETSEIRVFFLKENYQKITGIDFPDQ